MSTFSKKHYTRVRKGFTLIETLVAISIIMVGILGPFALIENNINSAYISRDEIIANSLAQDGIEQVRFARDTFYLTNRLNGITGYNFMGYIDGSVNASLNCVTPHYCTINTGGVIVTPKPAYLSPIFSECSFGACTPLYIHSADYTYTQTVSTNIQSKFTRTLQLCYMNGAACNATPSTEVKAVVSVAWTTLGRSYQTTVTDYLQNWLQ